MYGVKTGFTNGANRCLVVSCKRGNMDIISVVLGADTKKDRTRDSIKIIEYAFGNYQMIDMGFMLHDEFDTLVESVKFNVTKGINNNLSLDLEDNDIRLYPVLKSNVKEVEIITEIKTDLEAPVKSQDKLRKNPHKYRRRSCI